MRRLPKMAAALLAAALAVSAALPALAADQRAERELAEAGVAFHMRRGALEYGQPFRSMEEAQEFARFYGKDKLS